MPLEEYRRKRDFARTPEPAPAAVTGTTGRFVVQRHRATRLHYDFRLEIEGVLVSWAVPKGPTLDPATRRMAVHVEDHPIEYFDFEGVIPAKQYGAGDVIVWDWGTWEPEAPTLDPRKAVADGELKFRLRGEKLKGRFTIVRTSRRPGSAPSTAFEDDQGEQWLLIHKKDEAAQTGWDAEDHPQSVKTGRTNDEVKADRDALWIGQAPAATAEIDLAGAEAAPLPTRIEPMLATLASKPFDDPDWLFEIKWDGYRVQAVVAEGKVRIWTRNLHDAETYFPRLLSPPSWIDAREAIVDGEVVAVDDDGRPDFSLLQTRLGEKGAKGLVYQAFDLLYLDGRSLLGVPLEDRKRLLKSVLREHPRVRFAAHVDGEGKAFHAAAAASGLEGVIAKLRRSRYEPGRRSNAWLKLKIRPEQELVVGGWTPGEGNARDLGALAVGVYEDGHLRFSGKVGSGFTGATRKDLLARLKSLAIEEPPFDPAPPKDYRGRWGGDLRDITWVRPELVIRAELGGWSRDGMVRQAAFKGVEAGRDPSTVTRETAVATTTAVKAAEAETPPMPTEPSKPTKAPAAPAEIPASWRVTDDELRALDALGQGGRLARRGRRAEADEPRQAAVRPETRRHRRRRDPHHQARADPLLRPDRADDAPPRRGPAAQPPAVPQRCGVARVLAEGHPRDRAEVAHPLARDRASTAAPTAAPTTISSPTARRRCAGSATRRASRSMPGPAASLTPGDPRSRSSTSTPGSRPPGTRPWCSRGSTGPRSATSASAATPRSPASAASRSGSRSSRKYDFSQTSAWVERVSRAVGATVPDLISWEWAKEARKGRARLDYTQNASIKTLVAPYAVRPAAGAPVSAPIAWDELDDPDLRPDRWTIRDLPERVERVGDLFAPTQTDAQELPEV